jgi:hypothetical protein
MVKQLKNRYSDPGNNRRFIVGIDRTKMRLYDVEQSANDDILDGPNRNSDKSVFDNSQFGSEDYERSKLGKKFDKKLLEGFK